MKFSILLAAWIPGSWKGGAGAVEVSEKMLNMSIRSKISTFYYADNVS